MEKRDLKADLELCKNATQGPWEICLGSGVNLCTTVIAADGKYMICDCLPDWFLDEGAAPENHVPNLQFIAEAREGWPHAIERAVKAETLVRELVDGLQALFDGNPHDDYEGWKNMWGKAHASLEKAKEVLGDV
mgnify:CR=1 FL=1